MDRFVVGRDRELAQLGLAIGSGDDGLRLAMLSGQSGLGKTTLADVVVEQARERGFETVSVRGRSGSLSTPFAPLTEALPELQALLQLTSNADTNIEQAGIALVQLITELTKDTALLIVIDDAQALDESTIAVLPFLSGVAEDTNLTLLFIEQTDAIGIPMTYRAYVDGLLSRRVVSHLRLGPMEPDAIRQVIAHALEMDSPEDAPAEIVQRAEGNPWFAIELAHGWKSGSADVPATIAAAATRRLHSLDDEGQTIVSAIAVCPEGAHIAWLEALSDQRPRQFVGTMEAILATGVVREDGDILTIAHPLMQQAIIEEFSAAMLRATHLELVDAIADSQLDPVITARAAAFHLSEAGRRDDAIVKYIEAADASEIVGKLHEARADLMHALALENDATNRAPLLRRTAMMATQLGDEAAVELWQELSLLAASTGDDDLYAFALYQTHISSSDRRIEPLRRAAEIAPKTNGWSSLAFGSLAFLDDDFSGALASDAQTVEIARATDDRLLQATALCNLAGTQHMLGQATDALATYGDAVQKLIALRAHDRVVRTWQNMIECLLGDNQIVRAVKEADASDQYVVDLGLDQIRPYTLAGKAGTLRAAGDLDRAAQVIDESVQLLDSFRNSPTYLRQYELVILIQQLDISNEIGSANASDLAAAFESYDLGHESGWEIEITREQLRARGRRGGLEPVLEELQQLLQAPEPLFVADVALWLSRQSIFAGSDTGLTAVRAVRSEARDWDSSARSQLIAAELDATIAVLDGAELGALDEIARRWAECGCALDALRVNAVTGSLALKRGDKEIARTYLQAAKDGLTECGASGDADLVAALLRQTGARSRAKSRTTKVGPLTKRELEIARLVASGLKNSEVAGTLFLAEKTVAAHLSNIYGKVEVKSRVQLGQWIRANDPDFETAVAGVS